MSQSAASVKKIVSLLEQFPADKVKHYASFRITQIERFCTIGSIPIPKKIQEEKIIESKKPQQLMKRLDVDKLKRLVFQNKKKPTDYKKELFSDHVLDQQYRSLKSIMDNKWNSHYKVSSKLLTPKGNPNYYTSLMADVNRDPNRGAWNKIKVIFTGKY